MSGQAEEHHGQVHEDSQAPVQILGPSPPGWVIWDSFLPLLLTWKRGCPSCSGTGNEMLHMGCLGLGGSVG